MHHLYCLLIIFFLLLLITTISYHFKITNTALQLPFDSCVYISRPVPEFLYLRITGCSPRRKMNKSNHICSLMILFMMTMILDKWPGGTEQKLHKWA